MAEDHIVSRQTRFEKGHRAMIWLSIFSLTAGALLARFFRIAVLVPATFVVVLLAIGAGLVQMKSSWSTLLIVAAAAFGIQVGYFAGMLAQCGLAAIWARRSGSFSDGSSARDVGAR